MTHAFFPFVLMRRDPAGRTPIATLSDGIQLALIYVTSDGDSKVLFREELCELGLDPVTTYLDSRERLSRLVRARLVRMRAVLGPARVRCLAFEHSFLAASCAVLPDLFEIAHAQLKADAMILAIPRRDLLVVAPNLGETFRKELHELVGADDRTLDACSDDLVGWVLDAPLSLGSNVRVKVPSGSGSIHSTYGRIRLTSARACIEKIAGTYDGQSAERAVQLTRGGASPKGTPTPRPGEILATAMSAQTRYALRCTITK